MHHLLPCQLIFINIFLAVISDQFNNATQDKRAEEELHKRLGLQVNESALTRVTMLLHGTRVHGDLRTARSAVFKPGARGSGPDRGGTGPDRGGTGLDRGGTGPHALLSSSQARAFTEWRCRAIRIGMERVLLNRPDR
jgi:hypothetical protein